MIIHSPIVSGSLTFANGATFTLPTGGEYSGSFSGSFQGVTFAGGTFTGNGSGLTFGGTGIVSGSSQVSYVGLSNIPAGIVSSSAQIDSLFNIDGLVSSSAQVTPLLPTGTISGSSQVDLTQTTNYASGIKTQLNSNTVVSGSSQIDGTAITNKSITIAGTSTALGSSITAATILQGTGVVSGSSQITAGSTTNFATDVKTQLDSNTVVSGSSQITISSTTGYSTFSSSLDGRIVTNTSNVSELYSSASLHASKFVTLGTYTASLETKNSTLATYTGSVDTKFSTIGTYTASLETKNSTLASVTGSLLSSQTNLNTYTGSLLTAFQVTGSKVNFLGDVVIYGTQSIINSQNVEIADNILYLAPTASIDNDLGIVGHYNDGTYRHAGIFMDASDGHAWKVFNGLTGETTATIDTAGTGFTLADFKGGAFTGTSFTGTINSTNGVVSGSSQIAFSGVTGTVSNAQLANSTISGISLGSNLATLTIGTGLSGTSYNGSTIATIANTGVLSITSNTGLSSNVSATGNVTITNTGVTSNVAGSGISVSGATGAVTITNTGVTSNVAGTGVSVSGATGAVTISIGQAVATTSNVQFNSLGIGMAASATAGRIDATNDIVAYSSSDIRFKENITPIESPLSKISKIGGYTYDWKEEHKIEHGYEGNDVGVIAQEIEEVLPQLVQTRESGYKAVKYDKLVALLIEGIKEQQTQIEDLRNKIEKLENGK